MTVTHPTGLHAQPSSAVVKKVSRFQFKVQFRYGNCEADALAVFIHVSSEMGFILNSARLLPAALK